MALDNQFRERFAEETVGYLREVEARFSVKIQRIAIDAPTDLRRANTEGRQCEPALSAAHLSYFQTPRSGDFDEILQKED